MQHSGRELARRTGRSYTGVLHALNRLVAHGLVKRLDAGQTSLYELNRQHLLAGTVEQMADARLELFRRLRQLISDWQAQPIHASLFGSTARGDGGLESDIDLLVVSPEDVDPDEPVWRSQIDELAAAVRRWTGNNAGIVEVSWPDFSSLRTDRSAVVDEIEEDAINLAGEPIEKLLG